MTVAAALHTLESSALGTYMRESSFGFVPVEIVHVLALTTVFGTIFIVDLRLLGLGWRRLPALALTQALLPITWTAFVIAALSGLAMFVSKATSYYDNFEFRMKVLLLALAGLNMAAFHLGPYRRIDAWERQLPPPPAVRLFGLVSMALWMAIIFFGRWIGFVFELDFPQ
jgi:hypothetical protein